MSGVHGEDVSVTERDALREAKDRWPEPKIAAEGKGAPQGVLAAPRPPLAPEEATDG